VRIPCNETPGLDLRTRLYEPAVLELLASAMGFPTAERLEQVRARYQEAGWHLLGIEQEGRLVGLIGLQVTAPGQAIIQHIAVAADARRLGIGRMLIGQAAAMLGGRRLTAATDAEAVGFYQRCGFTVQSLGEKYPGVERFLCTRDDEAIK